MRGQLGAPRVGPTGVETSPAPGGRGLAWLGARQREPEAASHPEGERHHLHRPTFRCRGRPQAVIRIGPLGSLHPTFSKRSAPSWEPSSVRSFGELLSHHFKV